MDIHRTLALAAALGALALAGGARAQDEQGFKMPSNNVYCIIEDADSGQPMDLRCDLQQMSTRPPPPPRDCPLSWGDAFSITPGGARGQLVCHGDTTKNDDLPTLAYGAVWNHAGFSCASKMTGVTCTNARGHGFSLSREAQKVF